MSKGNDAGHTASLVAQQQPERITRLVLEEPPVPAREATDPHGLSTARFLLPALSMLAVRRGFDRTAVTSAVRQLRVPDPRWWQRLSSITAPTMLISGGPRSHVSPQRLAQVVRCIPDARLVTIPVGHRVHSHDPRRFSSAALPFLAPEPPDAPETAKS